MTISLCQYSKMITDIILKERYGSNEYFRYWLEEKLSELETKQEKDKVFFLKDILNRIKESVLYSIDSLRDFSFVSNDVGHGIDEVIEKEELNRYFDGINEVLDSYRKVSSILNSINDNFPKE